MTDRLGESWSVILTNRDLGPTVSGSRRKRTCKVNASYGVGVLWLLRDVVDAGSVWWVFVGQVAVGGLHPFTTGNVGKTTLGGPVQSPSMTIRMHPVFLRLMAPLIYRGSVELAAAKQGEIPDRGATKRPHGISWPPLYLISLPTIKRCPLWYVLASGNGTAQF